MSNAGKRLIGSAREARSFARGDVRDGFVVHVPAEVDVRSIRKSLGMSQATFAARFGFGLDAIQDWEQGRRKPDRAARAYLTVIACRPEAVDEALAG